MDIFSSQTLTSQYVEYSSEGTTFEAYLVHAEVPASLTPCVVITHDWSGLNQFTRSLAERVAQLGYVGFAIDIYGKRIRGVPTGDNSALMNPLIADRVLLRRRLVAGLRAAQNRSPIDPNRLAVIGHCFGGLCALDMARAAPAGLKGAVSFHGPLISPNIDERTPITASILILHGWEDPFAPPADVLAIAQELTQRSADWQLQAYGNAKHGFTFKGVNMLERGILYDESADRRSWAAMKAFLSEVLA